MNRRSTLLCALALSGCLTSMPNATESTTPASDAKGPGETSKSASAGSEKAKAPAVKKPLSRVVGYFPDWTYSRDAKCRYTVEDIDPTLFTHLNFAFARVDGGERSAPSFKLAPFDKTDLGPNGQYARFVGLKKKNPKLKLLLSVGGWTHSDPPYDWIFSAMAETPGGRKQFVDSAIKYLRDNGFDGLDLDWEYPSEPTRGGRAMDTTNYVKLLRDVRAGFDAEKLPAGKDKLLFTTASPAGVYIKWYDLPKIHPSLDWINLMSYDYSGNWDHRTGHNAPNPDYGPGVAASVSIYEGFGVPPEKIVVGMAAYGYTFGGVEEAKVGTPSTTSGPKQHCTDTPGLIAYSEVVELLNSGRAKAEWDDNAHVPFAYDEKAKVFFSYDDPRSWNQKLDFIESKGLGGAMIWEIDQDDFKHGNPLISTAFKRLPKE